MKRLIGPRFACLLLLAATSQAAPVIPTPETPSGSAAEDRSGLSGLREHLQKLRERIDAALRDAAGDRAASRHEKHLEDLSKATSRLQQEVTQTEAHLMTGHAYLRDLRQRVGPCRDGRPAANDASAGVAPPEVPAGAEQKLRRAFGDLEDARERLHTSVQQDEHFDRREALFAGVVDVLEESKEVLEHQPEAERRAGWLNDLRGHLAASDMSPCAMANVLLPELEDFRVSNLREDPLRPFRHMHERGRVARQQRVERRARAIERGEWGIGIGTIFTPADASMWEAVPTASNPGDRVIRRVDQENRSGAPVLMVTFRPLAEDRPFPAKINPAVELGFAVDEDRAFFVGGAFDVGPLLRVGVGYTMQQVRTLAGDLEEGDVLAAGDVLRTESEYDGDVYLSVTVALERFEIFRLRRRD